MAAAQLNLKLLGKTVLTEKDYIISMNVLTKKEQDYYLNNLSPEETIDYSDVSNIRMIVFYSPLPYAIKLTKDTNIITIPVKDLFVIGINAMTGFDSIKLSSLNTSSHYIEVKFYGI